MPFRRLPCDGTHDADELRAAVEKPAEAQGAAFEAGLVERILDDVGDEPGNLPLLEFALTLLWEQQTDGWLTHADYEAIGAVQGALARYADEVYEGLEAGRREQAQRVFVQLVRPGEGTEDTRRLARREELGEIDWSLVQHLADKRLVVTGRDTASVETVEVVHEALIDRWARLRGWMDAARTFRTWQERLRASMSGWENLAATREPCCEVCRLAEAISGKSTGEMRSAPRKASSSPPVRLSKPSARWNVTVADGVSPTGLAGGLVIALVLQD